VCPGGGHKVQSLGINFLCIAACKTPDLTLPKSTMALFTRLITLFIEIALAKEKRRSRLAMQSIRRPDATNTCPLIQR
jgi:hypothetical protein